ALSLVDEQGGINVVDFQVRGTAREYAPLPWVDTDVELVTTIEHNCGANWSCVCKDHGKHSEDLFKDNIQIDDLQKTELKWCDICEYANN
ncbi:hypothetical protein PMAYCL1PPCAC_22611, partial [Pristionchus mayeri]